MSKQKVFRTVGLLASVALIAVCIWQFLPNASAQKANRRSISDDASVRSSKELPDDDSLILLNATQISMKSEQALKDRPTLEAFSGRQMHLVRFRGPIQPEWHKMLVDSGSEIVDYIPSYTYLVYGDSNSLRSLSAASKESQSPIEWDGAYKNEYKIAPTAFVSDKTGANKRLASERFQIQLVKDPSANADTLQLINSIKTSEVKGQQEIMHYVNLVAGLDSEGVDKLAERPDVISIAPYFEPVKLDERQDFVLVGNLTGNAPTPGDYLAYLAGKGFTQSQFDASNFAVDLTDSGVDNANPAAPNEFVFRRSGDPALASRFIYSRLVGTPHTGSTLQGCDGHGNLNASIISGYVPTGGIFAAAPHADASGFRYGLGIAPFVKLGSSVIFDPNSFTSPNYANLQSQAYNDGARISSNSWGSSANTYTTDSQSYDALVRDAQPTGSTNPAAGNQEMTIVFAAGNDGSGSNTVGSPSTGKNVITVAAGEGVQAFSGADGCGIDDSGADSANDIIFFSSRGPTSDGRKKPDITLPGTHISGTVAQATNVSPVSGTGAQLACYDGNGVCGGIGSSVFFPNGQQWYTASSGTSHSTPAISGFAALIRQDFINRGATPPSPAMTKALMMNTASYMNGAGANDTLPSNNQGMGRANMNSYFDLYSQARILHDQTNADRFTATGQQRVITGTVASNAKPFKVTLAWTDVPGSTTGNAFVNNLDLEVTVGGQTYKGNVYSGANSVTGGTADVRNNVESVSIPAGVSGNFVVKVKATNIAGDGVPGNADPLDQDFALVVGNGNEASLPVVASGATTITAESCGIPNNAIDPNETVTIDFALSNIGTANTTNLTATLLATGGVTAPSGPQNYGALVANGPAVSKSFTFTAGTTCGQTITATFQLSDGATSLGTVTFSFLTGALSAPVTNVYTTGNVAVPIPDSGSVDVPITINDTGVVDDINVRIRLDHTFDGDVVATLVSPTGVSVPLVANRGGSGDNFGSGANDCSGNKTVFDDSAATAISAGTAPFVGSFRPESPLTAANGLLVNGIWKVQFADTADLDVGTVGCVDLQVSRKQFVCCGVAGTPTIASGGPAVITAESFTPLNNTPDPGETVTANFPLINTGTGNTTNLVATLQNSGGITPVTTSQNYGVVVAAGSAVSRPFTFVANGVCGGTVTATFHLQDGATDLGNVTYTFQLGTTNTNSQTFTNPAAITINDNSSASPYPSNITVAGAPSTITTVKVGLNGFSHTFPDDVDILLVSPTGKKMIIMSDAGGSTVLSGVSFTLDDAASTAVPDGAGIVNGGSYKPGNYTGVVEPDAWPAPAPAAPYATPPTATFANTFGGAGGGDPNGTWSLYVVDDAGGDVGSFSGGWSLTVTTVAQVCSTGTAAVKSRADFDADGKTDLSVFRPSDGNWYAFKSAGGVQITNWGSGTDTLVPGDYDNDGKADTAVYRPSTGQWFILNSSNSTVSIVSFGVAGDVPVAGDYDGDGKTDEAVYRPSAGQWYAFQSSTNTTSITTWGNATDVPVQADYDADGKTDVAVFRPSNGQWFIYRSTAGPLVAGWGVPGDKPVQADYDGDNKDDLAVYRPSDGNWYIFRSSDNQVGIVTWGNSTDVPVPGDYDGDGKDDEAVFRNGTWFVFRSTAGPLTATFGVAGDVAIPSKYIP